MTNLDFPVLSIFKSDCWKVARQVLASNAKNSLKILSLTAISGLILPYFATGNWRQLNSLSVVFSVHYWMGSNPNVLKLTGLPSLKSVSVSSWNKHLIIHLPSSVTRFKIHGDTRVLLAMDFSQLSSLKELTVSHLVYQWMPTEVAELLCFIPISTTLFSYGSIPVNMYDTLQDMPRKKSFPVCCGIDDRTYGEPECVASPRQCPLWRFGCRKVLPPEQISTHLQKQCDFYICYCWGCGSKERRSW